MALYWHFKDYVNLNGKNVFKSELDVFPPSVRAKIDARIRILRVMKKLDRPQVGQLHGKECKGLIELVVKVDKKQFRPLAFYGPGSRQVTLLSIEIERGGKLPSAACQKASQRMKIVRENQGCTCDHDFGRT